MLSATLQCWRLLSAPLRRRWLWLAPLGGLTALLDLLTAALLYKIVIGLSSQSAADGFLSSSSLGAAGLLLSVLTVKTVLRIGETRWREQCTERSTAELAAKLLGRWLDAPLRQHLATPASQRVDDVQSLASDVSREGLCSLVLLISESLVVVALLAVLASAAPLSALLCLIALGGLTALGLHWSHRRHARWVEAQAKARPRMQEFVQSCIAGIAEIRISGQSAFFVRRFRDIRGNFGRALIGAEVCKQTPMLVIEAAFVTGLVMLMAAATRQTSAGILPPLLVLLVYTGLRLLPAFNRIVYRSLAFHGAGASAVRAAGLLAHDTIPSDGCVSPNPLSFKTSLAVRDAWLTYPERSTPALSGVSLEIRRGERLALVGPSGGGKSTLLLLLSGLLPPDRGAVEADGAPVQDGLDDWQRHLGFVGQQTFLIDDTLEANIALGCEPGRIDGAALAAAVSTSRLDEVVAGLPAGLATRLGENGLGLSGGQRQRVAIARALYRRPAVLLLDEATAFLDQPVEQQLIAALARERPDLTTLFVTHRLASAQSADRVAFVRGGRVEACAPFAELAAAHPGFQGFLASADFRVD